MYVILYTDFTPQESNRFLTAEICSQSTSFLLRSQLEVCDQL